jgi:hypothetical protein
MAGKEGSTMQRGIRQLLKEAPGKEEGVTQEGDFWAGKIACWEMCHCPTAIRNDCPASKYTALPCWEVEGTYCKLEMKEGGIVTGTDTSICEACRVYKSYGEGKHIELKLRGKGINANMNTPERLSRLGVKATK